MDSEQQKEIYNKWKELEKECYIEAQTVVPGKKYKINSIIPGKMMELSKYQRWVYAYCLDILDASEKFEIQSCIGENQIQCKCNTPDCAKCLLINCKDDDCYYHPVEKKENFRLRYKNR